MKINPLQLMLDFLAPPVTAPVSPPASTVVPEVPPLRYEVLHSPRRRTLGLEVHRDLRVVIRAPLACPEDLVVRYVARHRRWITRQLAHFQEMPAPRAPLRYVDGEQHLYRGRYYRLQLRPENRSKVWLEDDCLVVGGVGASTPATIESALARWYQARAKSEFPAVVEACHTHLRFARYPLPALRIRAMRTRWGTLCQQRGMTLNSVLIQASAACLEYVVYHELCHLSYRGHGVRFHQLLTAVVPDWEARKRELEATITW